MVQALFCSWIHLLSFKLKILTLSSLKFIRAKIYAPFWSQLSVHAEKKWGSSRFSLSDLLKWPSKTRVYNSVQTELHLRFSKNLREKNASKIATMPLFCMNGNVPKIMFFILFWSFNWNCNIQMSAAWKRLWLTTDRASIGTLNVQHYTKYLTIAIGINWNDWKNTL